MAVYINKAGTKVDEAVVGAKSAADWAAQGFSAYTPTNTPAQTPAPANLKTGSVAIPKGQIANYTVTGQTGVTGQAGSTLYGIPKTISADKLGEQASPINLPANTQAKGDDSSLVAGAVAGQKTSQDYIKELTVEPTKDEGQRDEF